MNLLVGIHFQHPHYDSDFSLLEVDGIGLWEVPGLSSDMKYIYIYIVYISKIC